jgi:hypothetical protein
VTEGLHRLLDGRREDLDGATAAALERSASRYDTHPAPRERMERLRALRTSVDVPDGQHPAWTLLGRREWSMIDLERAFIPGEGPPGSWDDAVRTALVTRVGNRSRLLLDQVAQQVPGAQRTAAWALYAVQEGHGPNLVRPLLRGDIPADQRDAAVTEVLADVLDALLLSTLAAQGLATVAVSWTGPAETCLVGPDGTRSPWPFWDDARAVAENPTRVAALAARLRELGANLDLPVEPAADGPATLHSSAEAAVAVVLLQPQPPGVGRRQPFDAVLYDDGVLLHPAPAAANGFAAGIRAQVLHEGGSRNAERVQALVEQVGGDPAGWAKTAGPPTHWIPFRDLSGWRKAGNVWRGERLNLTRPDGTTLSLRITNHTVRIGDAGAVLDRALG